MGRTSFFNVNTLFKELYLNSINHTTTFDFYVHSTDDYHVKNFLFFSLKFLWVLVDILLRTIQSNSIDFFKQGWNQLSFSELPFFRLLIYEYVFPCS